jgi:hypothetical protein
VIIPVTNVSDRPYCYISVRTSLSDYLDPDGNPSGIGFNTEEIAGSVARLGSSFNAACLAPGETGYVLDNDFVLSFSQVAGVKLALQTFFDSADIADPLSRPVPVGYAFSTEDGLTITVQNQGTAPSVIDGMFNGWMLLDDAGQPLWFHSLKTADGENLTLAPGGSGTLQDTAVHYQGAGGQIRVFLDFSDGD